jgi:hypothetical protein
MADRAWLETVIPPVSGKEMEEVIRPIPQTRVSAFFISHEKK